ncbi:MAG TPA: HAMP domain-containing protein [Dehalococcoidia bacterium]|nr:HAMP domain-containing protein [Dehalococcoidia bacterium]
MSLRLKLTIAIAALVLALGLGGTFHARFTLASISREQLEKRGLALADDLANRAAEPLLTNDVFSLYRSVNEILAINDDVHYIFILGSEGSVKAGSFEKGLPQGLRGANQAGPGPSVKRLATSEGGIVDVAAPVLGGQAGIVRVGLSEQPLEARVNSLTLTLLTLTGVVLGAGLMVAWGLATVLTRPLARLAQAARAIGQGDLSPRVSVRAEDEVGRLARAFNRMTEALDSSRQELQRKEEVSRQLLVQAITAQEEERKRVARELHDETAQALTALLMALESAQGAQPDLEARGALERAYRLGDALLAGTRRLILDLRPTVLDDLGLLAALRFYAEARLGPETEVRLESQGLQDRLPPEVETALFRIFQEAINNCARHARAQQVSIGLVRCDSLVSGWVEDDGAGFDVEAALAPSREVPALGLLGMKERASLLGGTLSFRARPGHGTLVAISLPVDEQEAVPGGHALGPPPRRVASGDSTLASAESGR